MGLTFKTIKKETAELAWIRTGCILVLKLFLALSLVVVVVHVALPSSFVKNTTNMVSDRLDTYFTRPSFEKNIGQVEPNEIQFIAKLKESTILFNPDRISFRTKRLNYELIYQNARTDVRLIGDQELGTKVNYYRGNDQSKWFRDVSLFQEVHYINLYDGINVEYKEVDGQLKSTYIVESGISPANIQWSYEGVNNLSVDVDGRLLLDNFAIEGSPKAWQEIEGKQINVGVKYQILQNNIVSFTVDQYDSTKPLIIDPILTHSSYLGGAGDDRAYRVLKLGNLGNYVVGYTTSNSLQYTNTQTVSATYADGDIFIARISGGGISIITYIGGNGDDRVTSIVAADSTDNPSSFYIAGYTASSDFPTKSDSTIVGDPSGQEPPPNGTFVQSDQAFTDGFIMNFDPYLGLKSSTYVGTAQTDAIDSVTIINNYIYISGTIENAGVNSTFIKKSSKASLSFDGQEFIQPNTFHNISNLASDVNGYLYAVVKSPSITEYLSTFFPSYSCSTDTTTIIIKFAPNAIPSFTPTYLTCLGHGADSINAMRILSSGTSAEVIVAGYKYKQPVGNDYGDAWLVRLNTNGSIILNKVFSGDGVDIIYDIAFKKLYPSNTFDIVVAGMTNSENFILKDNFAGKLGGTDVFVARVTVNGDLINSSMLGGNNEDGLYTVGISDDGYVVGTTYSDDFPTKKPSGGVDPVSSKQSTDGSADAFIAKVDDGIIEKSVYQPRTWVVNRLDSRKNISPNSACVPIDSSNFANNDCSLFEALYEVNRDADVDLGILLGRNDVVLISSALKTATGGLQDCNLSPCTINIDFQSTLSRSFSLLGPGLNKVKLAINSNVTFLKMGWYSPERPDLPSQNYNSVNINISGLSFTENIILGQEDIDYSRFLELDGSAIYINLSNSYFSGFKHGTINVRYAPKSIINIINTEFRQNQLPVKIGSATVNISASSFIENASIEYGAALVLDNPVKVNISNTTFYGNKSVVSSLHPLPGGTLGGAIYIRKSTAAALDISLYNLTFANNEATHGGAIGIFSYNLFSSGDRITAVNVIAYQNQNNTVGVLDSCYTDSVLPIFTTNSKENLIWPDNTCGVSFVQSVPSLGATLGKYGGTTNILPLLSPIPGDKTVCKSYFLKKGDQRHSVRYPLTTENSEDSLGCDKGAYDIAGFAESSMARVKSGIGVYQYAGIFDLYTQVPAPYNTDPNYYYTFGCVYDAPVIGDWNGDGIDTAGIYRVNNAGGCGGPPTAFFVNTNVVGGFPPADQPPLKIDFGKSGDIPVSGHLIGGEWAGSVMQIYGDTHSYLGLYRPSNSTFYLTDVDLRSLTPGQSVTNPSVAIQLGIPGDLPVVGDWDGDGIDTPGVYRPSTGQVILTNENCLTRPRILDVCKLATLDGTLISGPLAYNFTALDLDRTPLTGYIPVAGDWNHDGITDIGLMKYRTQNVAPGCSEACNEDDFKIIYLDQLPFANTSFKIGPFVYSLGHKDYPVAGFWRKLTSADVILSDPAPIQVIETPVPVLTPTATSHSNVNGIIVYGTPGYTNPSEEGNPD